MNLYQPTITGSLSVSGSVNISGSITIEGGGTISGTASYATNAELLDGLDSTVFTLTSSFAAQTASFTAFTASILAQTASLNSFSASVLSYTSSLNAKTSSFATTGSNTFAGVQTVNSNLIVTGSITAQTLVVQTITSSVDFVTGSTRFGSSLSTSTHQFTGSVNITGSVAIASAATYALDVSGTGRFTGNLQLGSTTASSTTTPITLNMGGTYGTTLLNGIKIKMFDDATTVHGLGVIAGNLYLNATDGSTVITLNTNNTERMRITSAGNVGIGVTPSAWGSNSFALQTQGGALWSFSSAYLDLWQNSYFNGTNSIYQTTAEASYYRQNNGIHLWYTAPSGTAGTTITFSERMRITSGGLVGIGCTPSYTLQVKPTTNVNMIVTNNGSNLQIGSSNDAGNAAIPINFTATSFTFNNDVTFSTNISLGANQRVKLSGGAGNLTGSSQTTISSTIATIFSGFLLGGVQTGNLVIINGVKSGTGWNFTDLVNYMTNGTITVISSSTVGSPPARTYSVSGNDLRLLIAGGDTGFVSCTALTQGYQA
jgi:hypothetical protein